MAEKARLMTDNALVSNSDVLLPPVTSHTSPMLEVLTEALGVNRDALPSDEQIKHAWSNLPRLLSRMPPELRGESLMRMCVAVASGLFDSGINYAWNAAIIELKEKVRRFDISIIPQIIDKDFDEKTLQTLRDSDLLSLCLKLNLISEHGYFMLDQCRDIRNNFSSAHPAIGKIDEDEFVSFFNRIVRFALNNEENPQAVDVKELIKVVQAGSFSDEQYKAWSDRILSTFEAQREAIFGMLHGIYCDSNKSESARVNAIKLCLNNKDKITPSIESLLINRHEDYQARGAAERHKASKLFFENLGMLKCLSESEHHVIISHASKMLLSVHNSHDNFYNEPPFAKRLRSLAESQSVPSTVQAEFVEAVVTCSVGNRSGTSEVADNDYRHIIQEFSPMEIKIMLNIPSTRTVVAERIESYPRCKKRFARLVATLKSESIPTTSKSIYDEWMKINGNTLQDV